MAAAGLPADCPRTVESPAVPRVEVCHKVQMRPRCRAPGISALSQARCVRQPTVRMVEELNHSRRWGEICADPWLVPGNGTRVGNLLPKKQRMTAANNVTVSVLGYREDDNWCALALKMDLRGYGPTFRQALEDLRETMTMQIGFAYFKNELDMIVHPAEPVFFFVVRTGPQRSPDGSGPACTSGPARILIASRSPRCRQAGATRCPRFRFRCSRFRFHCRRIRSRRQRRIRNRCPRHHR